MEIVCAGFRDYVYNPAYGAATFGTPAMLRDLKLLNRFIGEVLQQAADDVVLVIGAVNIDVNLPAIAAAESNRADMGLGRVKCADRAGLGNDHREIGECAINKR